MNTLKRTYISNSTLILCQSCYKPLKQVNNCPYLWTIEAKQSELKAMHHHLFFFTTPPKLSRFFSQTFTTLYHPQTCAWGIKPLQMSHRRRGLTSENDLEVNTWPNHGRRSVHN